MPQVTSARVVFARTVQPAQYESAKVEVEFSVLINEGESAMDAVNIVGEMAKSQAYRMLGLKVPSVSSAAAPDVSTASVLPLVSASTPQTAEAEQPKRTRRTKAEMEAARNQEATSPKQLITPLFADDATPAALPVQNASTVVVDDEDFLKPADAVISDGDLTAACGLAAKTSSEIAAKIKDLKVKYSVPRVIDLPQDKRSSFLMEVNALTK